MNESIVSISKRLKNEFFLGVVGSVRSGKSTFIRKFIEIKVLPFIDDEFLKNKIIDELPQTSDGKQIMTVEPKFVPQVAIPINIDDTEIDIRLVDSVGYIIPSAIGYENNGTPRLIETPWFNDPIPFSDAALLGTRKIIENHSNIAVFITSDGSFGEFNRGDYEENEEKIIKELKDNDKPFIIVINSQAPDSDEVMNIKKDLEEKYEATAVPINILKMSNKEIDEILNQILREFKIEALDINIPSWISALDNNNSIKNDIMDYITKTTSGLNKIKHLDEIKDKLITNPIFTDVYIDEINPENGNVVINVVCDDDLYYKIIDDIFEKHIETRGEFIKILEEYKIGKKEYDKYKDAFACASNTGYGIALPTEENIKITDPEIISLGGRYGIKIKAIGSSIHMVRVDVESTFEPIIGSAEQSKILIDGINANHDIWNQEIFGRKLSEVVNDGIRLKLDLMGNDIKERFRDTIEKIVNKGNGGIIAIIL